MFERQVVLDPFHYFYQLGQRHFQSRDWSSSITALNHALELQPDNQEAQLTLAYALLFDYQSKQDLLEGERLFQQSLQNAPTDLYAQGGLKQIKDLLHVPQEDLIAFDQETPRLTLPEPLTKQQIDQPLYFYELGRHYSQAQEWENAIMSLHRALELQPDNPDTQLALAYAYLFFYLSNVSLVESEQLFQQVLRSVPTYTDAKEGLKRITAIKQQLEEEKLAAKQDKPEALYELGKKFYQAQKLSQAFVTLHRALELQPDNPDIQLTLAYTLLAWYSSHDSLLESQRLFQGILRKVPTYTDATEGLKKVDALLRKIEADKKSATKMDTWVERYLSLAKEFTTQGNYGAVVEIYLVLTKAFPKNAEYLFQLGLAYNRMERRCEAITAFEQALDLKPDYSDALIALGNQYLFFKDFETSHELFSSAVIAAPKDPDAWFGLARTEASLGHVDQAEAFYETASTINPDYVDIQRSHAGMLLEQRRYTEAESLYRNLDYREGSLGTHRLALFNVSAFTRPTFYASASGTEEREKDFRTRRWVSTLSYLNADAGVVYPINDEYRLSLRGHTGYTRQKNLFSNTVLFNTKSDSLGLRGEWFYNPFWTFSLFANIEFASNHDEDATLFTKRRTLFQPSIAFRYTKDPYKVIFGEITDAWIYKDFNKNKVLVIPRESLFVFYERKFGDYHFAGADAAWIWYQDPIHNQEQDLSGWIQTGLPGFEELSVRYHCVYRQFRRETSAYYTFRYQLTHWLKFHWFKRWLVGGRFDLEYWHGWRTTRGRDPQEQITVGPLPGNLPITTVEDQIDWVALTLGYTFTDYFDVNATGSYYHDSFDYTVWSGRIGMEWRF